jgi:hypothetical protein
MAYDEESTKVMYKGNEGGPSACTTYARLHLLIFNIHGRLLDCSLLSEKNPNSKIRTTIKTETCRIVFRPWLIDFLSRCINNFVVAF